MLTRADKVSITSLSSKAHALLQAAGSEPSRFNVVSLSKIETLLLASLSGKGTNRNSLACLRNGGFHSAQSYGTHPGFNPNDIHHVSVN